MADEFSTDLIAVLCVWNEEALLPGCLDSLAGKVDRIVLADGRYSAYPGDSDCSTDATLEIAREYGCDVIPCPDGGWESEHAKRTALVRCGSLGDMYLVIDADERLEGGYALRTFFGDYALVVQGVGGTPGRQDAVRLFAHRDGLTYHWHFHIRSPAGIPILRAKDWLPKGTAWISHHHHLREPDRVRSDKEYEAHLVPFERSLGAYQ